MQTGAALAGQFHGRYDICSLRFSEDQAAQLELNRIPTVIFEGSRVMRVLILGGDGFCGWPTAGSSSLPMAGPFSALLLLALLLLLPGLPAAGPLLSPHEARPRTNAKGIKGAQPIFLLF